MTRIGLAVSGGPDSLALLLLAAAARPGLVEAASVDHGLRDGSRGEAEAVARRCAQQLGVPHDILTIDWRPSPDQRAPGSGARRALCACLATGRRRTGSPRSPPAHHADDQAETLLMRLARGAGVRGLAGMRPSAPLPGRCRDRSSARCSAGGAPSLRAIVAAAGLDAARRPRPTTTSATSGAHAPRCLPRATGSTRRALAASAAHLAAADEAIEYAVDAGEWRASSPGRRSAALSIRAMPRANFAAASLRGRSPRWRSEGDGGALRGRELDRAARRARTPATSATLRGVLASGGRVWRFRRAPPRR